MKMEIDKQNAQKNNLKDTPKLIPSIEQLTKRVIEKKPKKKKKRYDVITYEKRVQLLEMIIKEKETIKNAADRIGIKLCTAKHILYLYKNEGKIHERKQDHQYSDQEELIVQCKDQREESSIQVENMKLKNQLKCIQNQNKLEIKSQTNQSQNQVQMVEDNAQLRQFFLRSESQMKKLKDVGLTYNDFTVQNFSILMMQNAMLTKTLQNLLNPFSEDPCDYYSSWGYNL